MLAETRDRGPRRNAPVTAAGHDQLAAGGKLDRRRRTARVAQLLAAAGRTLRAGRDVMLDDGRAQQVEADDVIAATRCESRWRSPWRSRRPQAGWRSGRAVAGRAAKPRRGGRLLRSRSALTSRFRFIRSARQVQQAPLPGREHGPHQGKNAGGLDQQPGRMVRQMLPVQFAPAALRDNRSPT